MPPEESTESTGGRLERPLVLQRVGHYAPRECPESAPTETMQSAPAPFAADVRLTNS